jgi:hypothetical protein
VAIPKFLGYPVGGKLNPLPRFTPYVPRRTAMESAHVRSADRGLQTLLAVLSVCYTTILVAVVVPPVL